jgi:hypothetical protein
MLVAKVCEAIDSYWRNYGREEAGPGSAIQAKIDAQLAKLRT